MKIYSKASVVKDYLLGILVGFLVLPAIILFSTNDINGIIPLLAFIIIATHRRGVKFEVDNPRVFKFNELIFFLRFGKHINLKDFSEYRIRFESKTYRLNANIVQYSDVNQKRCVLEIFSQQEEKYFTLVKTTIEEIKPLIKKLEQAGIKRK